MEKKKTFQMKVNQLRASKASTSISLLEDSKLTKTGMMAIFIRYFSTTVMERNLKNLCHTVKAALIHMRIELFGSKITKK